MQTVEDKTVISGLRWYASDQYRLLITVGGVGGDFSQTGAWTALQILQHRSGGRSSRSSRSGIYLHPGYTRAIPNIYIHSTV